VESEVEELGVDLQVDDNAPVHRSNCRIEKEQGRDRARQEPDDFEAHTATEECP
jgi:hypothetical protein